MKLTSKVAEGLFFCDCYFYNLSGTASRATSRKVIEQITLNIFTNRKKCDIIIVPNKLNIQSLGVFFLFRDTYTLF